MTGRTNIGLRVPDALKRRLQEAADANHRNLSQEAARRLERSFDPKLLAEDAASIGYALSPPRTESE